MTFSNEIIFLMLSLIVLGMTVHAKSLYDGVQEPKPSRVLMLTFVLANLAAVSAMSYAWVSPVFLTLTNTLVLATACCAALTARSWRLPLSAPLIRWTVSGFACIALVFEVLRQNGTYLDRLFVYAVLSSVFLCWLAYEAWQMRRQENTFQLTFLVGVALASLALRLARLALVLGQQVHPETLFQEALAPATLRLMSLSMDILILSSLLGFSTHVLALWHQKSREDNERVRQANEALAVALADKNKMIKALSLSVKSNNMGVLLASLTHELSQPLQVIRLKAELLASMPEMAPDDRQHLLQTLAQETVRGVTIMNQLRNFLRQGGVAHRRMALDRLVIDSVDILGSELLRQQITLDKALVSPVWVSADEGQLQMVVLNLLKNAIDVLRPLPQPRHMDVRLELSGKLAVLTVSDNGSGIPQSQMAQLFDMFYSTKEDGMGLGLWLSHSIMLKHGGNLTAANNPSGGASFTMTLPLDTAHNVGAEAPTYKNP